MPITINGTGSISGISVGGLPDGCITTDDIAANAVTDAKLTGTTCKAWVNFNGTLAAASMIRASYNVSSITDNGTGDYTVNFTTAMPDANYSITAASGRSATTSRSAGFIMHRNLATTSFDFQTSDTANGALDHQQVTLAIFR